MDLDEADKLASVASGVMNAAMLWIMIRDRVRATTPRRKRARHALEKATFGRRFVLRSLVVALLTAAATFSQTKLCGEDPTKGAPCNWASVVHS
ncbi:hypothetical protein ADK67_27800 [Saccharothrix sp. NRRL B-16348]|nr:hypothetical protein ADK67_27800 [Saccharothrix sp. NRRL B-16348]